MPSMPDYYEILDIAESSSPSEIREAYKKQALLHHPDRLSENASAQEKAEATRQFQLVADAYYVLGNPARREAYDRNSRQTAHQPGVGSRSPANADRMFSDAFEELLKPEVAHPSRFWRIVGACAGFVLGFIIANLPGAILGLYAGKTLGQIRDNKGVSVYAAFHKLEASKRRDILTMVVTRVLTHGTSGLMN